MKEWEQFLSNLEQELGPSVVNEWLRPLKVAKFDAANLYLEAKNPMQISWFEEHVRPRLKKKGFLNGNNRPIKVHFSSFSKKNPSPTSSQPTISFQPLSLDPACTLETFSTTSGNLMAYKLLSELAHSGFSHFNPIFLYGPKKSGKTHLLMAIAKKLSGSKKVFYTSADAFTDHVVQAIRTNSMSILRQIYRDIDLLMIDDVDRFGGRSATQEEFFHTFNTLHTLGKQLILCSEYPPSKLQEIESRLISRFEWGIAVGIERGDPLEILKHKAKEWSLCLEEGLLPFLIEKFPRDPVIPLQALALRVETKEPITIAAAIPILKDLLSAELLKARTPEGVIQHLASHFGIKKDDLIGKGQSRDIAFPRKIAMYVCRKELKMSFQSIGKLFDRDHSTVMASVKQIEKEVEDKNKEVIEATMVASQVKS